MEENKIELKYVSVDPAINKKYPCGAYWLNEDIKVSMQVSSLATWDSDAYITPINAVSRFETYFSIPVSLGEVIEAYLNLHRFITFITNRRNIEHFDIRLVGADADTNDQLKYIGTLCMTPADVRAEGIQEDVRKRTIKYQDIGESTGILTGIMNEDFSIVYRPSNDSIKDFSRWSHPKLIVVLVALDNNLTNSYGEKVMRSSEFNEVKREILNSVDSLKNGFMGKKRKYASEIYKLIKKHDNSYRSRLLHALEDNQAIIEPFIRSLPGYKGTFEQIAEGISDRVGNLRNDLSHGRFGISVKPQVLIDMRVIEILNYSIILKRGEVNERSCVKSLSELFDDKLALYRYDGKL